MQDGATPLHLAAQSGHLEVVRCLCAAGCAMDLEDMHGLTAEDVATCAGHRQVAALIHHLRQVGGGHVLVMCYRSDLTFWFLSASELRIISLLLWLHFTF